MVFKTVKIEYKPQDNKTGSFRRGEDLQLGHSGRHGIAVGLTGARRRPDASSPRQDQPMIVRVANGVRG